MTYPTFINIAYWTLAALIVLLLGFIAVLGVSIVWMRSRRFAHDRAVRLARIERFREDRPPYDPASWSEAASVAYALTFGEHGAALVQVVADAQGERSKQARSDKAVRLVTV